MIVSLEDQDKAWLERRARESGVSMSEVVRQAVQRLKRTDGKSFDRILQATSGIWKGGDGLAYQRKTRREWK
jgi:Arc/MetJ-type ribon-helix-helix transcriptional regulator